MFNPKENGSDEVDDAEIGRNFGELHANFVAIESRMSRFEGGVIGSLAAINTKLDAISDQQAASKGGSMSLAHALNWALTLLSVAISAVTGVHIFGAGH
jgi:hypothetical protein